MSGPAAVTAASGAPGAPGAVRRDPVSGPAATCAGPATAASGDVRDRPGGEVPVR